jgi:hypothetical protein
MASSERLIIVDPSFSSTTTFKLLDLPDELASAVLAGKPVSFKGGAKDDMVICTEESTYSLRFVETSNTVLLGSSQQSAVHIHGAVGGLIEVGLLHAAVYCWGCQQILSHALCSAYSACLTGPSLLPDDREASGASELVPGSS